MFVFQIIIFKQKRPGFMRFLLVLLCLFMALPAHAGEITHLQVDTSGESDRVSVRLTARVKYRVFNVEAHPPRVAIDMENTRPRGGIALPAAYKGTLIRGVRFGFHNE